MIRLILPALVFGVAPMLLAAEPQVDQVLHVVYDCAGDDPLEAVFVNTSAGGSYAVVTRGGGLIPMTIAISASGARYVTPPGTAPLTLWTKGNSASLYEGEEETPVLTDCIARETTPFPASAQPLMTAP